MRCNTIENLLPLYVEGDLTEDETLSLRAHLSSCEACRRTEEEFRVSQSRLHAFAAPEFDEEFYESIRGVVMTEILARPCAPVSFFQTLRTLFLSRPIATAALASMVVCAALLLGVYRQLPNRSASLVAVEKGVKELTPNQYASYVPTSAATATRKLNMERERLSTSAYGLPLRRNLPPVNQPSVKPDGLTPERANEPSTVAQKTTVDSSTSDNATQTQAVARIEIQTSDPNIRIIWLGR